MTAIPSHTVAIVAFEGVNPFHLSVPCAIFGEDLGPTANHGYNVVVCAEEKGSIPTQSGFSIDVPYDFDVLQTANTLIIPGWFDLAVSPSESLLVALRKAHTRDARVVGLCLGTFVLAEAGLLDNRTACTHWLATDEFTRRYQSVSLTSKVLYHEDSNIVTSAGTAAAIDCCLHLLRSDQGANIANSVARRMVTAPHRSGGQDQFIEQPIDQRDHQDPISSTLDWALENLSEELSLEHMANHTMTSRRTFSRHFRKATGTTVNRWVRTQRLSLAQRLLETTEDPLEDIAQQAGFGSASTMRQHFTNEFSISPSAYRKQFRLEARTHSDPEPASLRGYRQMTRNNTD